MDTTLFQKQGGPPPFISVVILNYNGKNYLTKCIRSLKKIEYTNFEVIVVDNGSSDGSQREVKKRFPDTILIENERNLGFAEGMNVGIRYALQHRSQFLLLLNNDTVVVDPKLFQNLVKIASLNETVGIVSPKISLLEKPGQESPYVPRSIKSKIYAYFRILLFNPLKQKDKKITISRRKELMVFDVPIVGAVCWLVKREVFRKIGLFDSNFYYLGEDEDFGIRAKKAGYKIYYVTTHDPKHDLFKVLHKGSATSARFPSFTSYLQIRNFLIRWRKHGEIKCTTGIFSFLFLLYVFSRNFSSISKLKFRGLFKLFDKMIMGYVDGLRYPINKPTERR